METVKRVMGLQPR